MESALILDILEVLEKHNVLPAHLLRNERVKAAYKMMRADGISCKDAKEAISKKHNISVKTVEAIIYGYAK